MSEFDENFYTTAVKVSEPPKPGPWLCYLFGSKPGHGGALTMRPSEDHVPNWFWRKMQFLILGNLWVKDQ